MSEPKEATDNTVHYCDEHQPEPRRYEGPLQELLGGYVKAAFVCPPGSVRREHMWVKVEAIQKTLLIGRVDNVPAYTTLVRYGQRVVLSRDDIEDWMLPESISQEMRGA